eukprot:1854213-Prymnesium_polylepis.1
MPITDDMLSWTESSARFFFETGVKPIIGRPHELPAATAPPEVRDVSPEAVPRELGRDAAYTGVLRDVQAKGADPAALHELLGTALERFANVLRSVGFGRVGQRMRVEAALLARFGPVVPPAEAGVAKADSVDDEKGE